MPVISIYEKNNRRITRKVQRITRGIQRRNA